MKSRLGEEGAHRADPHMRPVQRVSDGALGEVREFVSKQYGPPPPAEKRSITAEGCTGQLTRSHSPDRS